MVVEPTLQAAALVLIAGFVTALAVFTNRNRDVGGATWLTVGLASIAVWSLAAAVVSAATVDWLYVAATKLIYAGAVVATPAFFAFALRYSGYGTYLTPVTTVALFVEPALTFGLVLTNEVHGLVYTELGLQGYAWGWWFFVHVGYDYLLLGLVAAILFRQALFDDDLYRSQAVALIVGAVAPWLAHAAWLVGVPGLTFDPTPLAFAVTGFAFVVAAFRSRLLAVAPVTREAGRTVLIESMDDAVFMISGDHRVVDANPAAAELAGVDPSETTGVPLRSLLPELEPLLPAPCESRSAELTLSVDGDQRHYDVRASPLSRSDGEGSGWVVTLSDVTERKERVEKLERYETVIEASGDPIYSLDSEGRIAFLNPAAEAITGYEEAELVGEHIRAIITEEDHDRAQAIIEELVAADDRRRVTFDATLVARDGERIEVEVNLAVLGSDEEFDGTAGVVRDVRDRKRRQEVLSVLNRALRHNLRTHVNAIDGYAELISEDLDGEKETYLDRIRESATWLGRLGGTLRDLHEAVEEDRGSDPAVEVADLLDAVVGTCRRRYPHATIVLESTPVTVDAGRTLGYAIEQVVENAIVHHDGADPTVRVRVVDAPRDGWVDIRVEDDGPGIPETERAVVLGETSTDQLVHGSGVGLWIARWIVQVFGGEILIADSDPRGTVVTFRLRRIDPDGASERGRSPTGRPWEAPPDPGVDVD